LHVESGIRGEKNEKSFHAQIHTFDGNDFKSSGVVSMATFPSPSRAVLAHTPDALRVIDARMGVLAQEYKPGPSPSAGLVR